MAKNLLKGGMKVAVYDVNPKAVDELVRAGALGSASSPLAMVRQFKCNTVITMLPTSKHVKEVYEDPKSGVLQGLASGALCIDSSTIDPQTARATAESSAKKGVDFVDAPVSGGVTGAQNATLTFMVGGSEKALERVRPVLSLMGKNIVHCGPNSSGQVAKLCNNLILAISMVGVSEGMNMGIKMGMDPKKLAAIVNTSTGRCWSSDVYNPCPGVMENVPSARGYTGGFAVDLMLKDLSLAMSAANSASQKLPLGSKAFSLFEEMSKNGLGQKDFSIVFEHLKKMK